MQIIIPFLWFNNQAEDAAKFYVAIFKNSKITAVSRYGKSGSHAAGRPEGSVMTVEFQLNGQNFMGLNGGPVFAFTPAISFMVGCDTQEEIDMYWEKLSDGGKTDQCGWLTDRFGVSWQIVPNVLGKLMMDKDSKRSERVMNAMLKMKKLDIRGLEEAHSGE